jgi:hypothetical protein
VRRVFQNIKWVADIFDPIRDVDYWANGNISRLRVDTEGSPIYINEWAIADYNHPDTAWAHERFSKSISFGPNLPLPPEEGDVFIKVVWGDD